MNFSANLIKLMKVFFILDETERWRQREKNRFDLFSDRVPKAKTIKNCEQEFCILIPSKKKKKTTSKGDVFS